MAFQKSVALRNAEINQIQATVGSAGIVKLFSGAEPANCAAADPAGLLCTINLPATFLGSASNGQVVKQGTWSAPASAGGTIASWRMYDSGLTCHMQGDASVDMTFDNATISLNQQVTVNTFSVTAPNP